MNGRITENGEYCGGDFDISWCKSIPVNSHYRLHNHSEYEIYIFISGDSFYQIEGRRYELNPYDILFVRPDEMHRVWHNSEAAYRRIIISCGNDFFKKSGMSECEKILREHSAGTDRKIRGTDVTENGLKDTIEKMQKYICAGEKQSSPIVRALFIEMLYSMCNINFFEKTIPANSKIQSAIDYINSNFKSDITLDDVSSNSFMSKHHLCRLFKKITGYTVGAYISHKRLMHTAALYKKGDISIRDACMEAGFGNYSNFYRAYKKENGVSPKDGMPHSL